MKKMAEKTIESFIKNNENTVLAKDLYKEYVEYCNEQQVKPVSNISFGLLMKKYDQIHSKHTNKGRIYVKSSEELVKGRDDKSEELVKSEDQSEGLCEGLVKSVPISVPIKEHDYTDCFNTIKEQNSTEEDWMEFLKVANKPFYTKIKTALDHYNKCDNVGW